MKVLIGTYPSGKSKKERKINVRIDPWDTWSLDHTLALIITPALKALQSNKCGAGFVDNEDVPEKMATANVNEKDGSVDKNWFKRWDYILKEMIWAFEQVTIDDYDKKFWNSKKHKSTNGYDKEGLKKHEDRMQNGFRLFGKYYRGMWT